MRLRFQVPAGITVAAVLPSVARWWIGANEARHEYGIGLRGVDGLADRLKPGGAVVDVRSFVDPARLPAGLRYWSL